mgnify:CR=1 FL=1
MRHGRNSAYGRKARQEAALERLIASKFTEKKMKDGHTRNEESWSKKKELDIERLEQHIKQT